MSTTATVVPSVFVYADGTVGLRDLDHEYQVFRVPRPPKALAFDADVELMAPVTVTVDEFVRNGSMFDGRPVFVAEGFQVLEIGSSWITLDRPWQWPRLDDQQLGLAKSTAQQVGAIELDRWVGLLPALEQAGLRKQCLVKRGVRLLVAVRR